MKTRIFEHWDWEEDRGERPLSADQPLPRSYAVAYYDYADRLYRVVVTNRLTIVLAKNALEHETDVFDYFCDESGRILEKRSVDDEGNVSLIVRFCYDDTNGSITETGWNPTQDESPQTFVRSHSDDGTNG